MQQHNTKKHETPSQQIRRQSTHWNSEVFRLGSSQSVVVSTSSFAAMDTSPSSLDAAMLDADVEGFPGCVRCEGSMIVNVLTPSTTYICKECIKVLDSFKDVPFKLRLVRNLILQSGDAALSAWLYHQALSVPP